MYKKFRVVMVNTSHPGNIGAAARAMKNMNLTELWLVAPRSFPDVKARTMAVSALDILNNAVVVDTLEQALVGCEFVVGASARLREIAWPLLNPREMAEKMWSLVKQQDTNKVALVFGRENSGLTNQELERCNYLVNIPANEQYSSLNIAAAIQVLCYEIHMKAWLETPVEEIEAEFPLATNDDMERLYQHFEIALTELEFLKPDNPKQLMRRIRRLFNRSGVDQMELNILRGILSAAQSKYKK
ncbi:MAG: RNA methyltransferase [Thiohalomonadales bacterium]